MRFASNSVARMDQQRQRHENISTPAAAFLAARAGCRLDVPVAAELSQVVAVAGMLARAIGCG